MGGELIVFQFHIYMVNASCIVTDINDIKTYTPNPPLAPPPVECLAPCLPPQMILVGKSKFWTKMHVKTQLNQFVVDVNPFY